MTAINIITNEAASGIIEHREPKGLFYTMESGMFVGIDNSTGDAWVEEFQSEMECRDWLIRKEDTHEKEIYKKALLKWGEGAQNKLARLEGKLNEPSDKHIENDVKGWK
jgi:hypothetical protein